MALKLPPLNAQVPIVDGQGRPTSQFMQFWQRFSGAIETEVGALQAAQLAEAAAATANAAAASANAAAAAAQTAADTTAEAAALANSFTSGLTISATDAGASATITISAHTRNYGDGATAAISGGSLTGLAYSTKYWIYYDAAIGTTGSVTYIASTSIQGNGTAPNRHFVGAVETPAALGGPVDGFPVIPPGSISFF